MRSILPCDSGLDCHAKLWAVIRQQVADTRPRPALGLLLPALPDIFPKALTRSAQSCCPQHSHLQTERSDHFRMQHTPLHECVDDIDVRIDTAHAKVYIRMGIQLIQIHGQNKPVSMYSAAKTRLVSDIGTMSPKPVVERLHQNSK